MPALSPRHVLSALALTAVLAFSVLSQRPEPVSAVGPVGVVKVRDYAAGDCSVDDTAAVQTAINAWLAQQKARTGGVLDFGTGQYCTSNTLVFAQPDGSPVYGEIRGDGTQLAVIHPTGAGRNRAMEFDDYWYSFLHGIGVDGGGGNRTGTAMVFTAKHDGLGTCCDTFQDLQVTNFHIGYSFGEIGPNGTSPAAAEITASNLTAQFTDIGFNFYGQNTLDIVFNKPAVSFSGTGFFTANTGQIQVRGGSATGNTTDFNLQSAGASFLIDGFRSETRHDPNIPLVILGATGQRVTIAHSYFDVTGTPAPVSIQVAGGPMLLELVENHLNGQVTMIDNGSGSIISHSNSIFAATPFNVGNGSWLDSEADYLPSTLSGEWFGAWQPFTRGFVAIGTPTAIPTATAAATATGVPTTTVAPTRTSTPTPVRTSTPTAIPVATATATLPPNFTYLERWDGHGNLGSTTHGATTTIPVSVTNTGNFTWYATGTNPVQLGYQWLDSLGAVLSWSTVPSPLPSSVAPNASLTNIPVSVILPTAPGSYTLHIDLLRQAVTWFQFQTGSTLSLPVQVQ